MVVTLHSNSSISTALSEALIWKVEDPYVEDNIDKFIFLERIELHLVAIWLIS
jgi:hypothetical protein